MHGVLTALELAIVLVSALLHAGWSVAIKGSRDGVSFNLIQTLVASAIAVALLTTVRLEEIPSAVWPIVTVTGVAHALYLYWLSRALSEADISIVYPIARATPAFLPLVAIPLLGERPSSAGVLGIAIVVAGMWLVSLGLSVDWRAFRGPGIAFAYGALATTVAYGILDKVAMSRLDATTWTHPVPRAVFYFFLTSLSCTVVYLPLCLLRRNQLMFRTTLRHEWRRALLALGVSLGSYGLVLEALRSAPASYVVAVRQSSVLFVLALGILSFGEQPGRARMLGAALTVAGVSLIALAPDPIP